MECNRWKAHSPLDRQAIVVDRSADPRPFFHDRSVATRIPLETSW